MEILHHNGSAQLSVITTEMKDVLLETKEAELKNGRIGEFVFCDANGERIHSRVISAHARNISLSDEFSSAKSIHAIRRTLNSNLRCMGVSAPVAAALFGHTEQVNEENYTYRACRRKELLCNSDAGRIHRSKGTSAGRSCRAWKEYRSVSDDDPLRKPRNIRAFQEDR